jgi:serine/threonine protein kinase/tetratricopeptide (TPR) repeat protein
MIACPPVAKWQDYVRDRLSRSEDRLLTDHVQTCKACEETLAGLVEPCAPPRSGASCVATPPADLVESLRRLWAARPEGAADAEGWPSIDGYEILGVLGRGGLGIVYRARQNDLGREVALKMLAAGEWSSAADARRLRHDAETAAALRHDHIVPVYAVGQHHGLPYCVMELIAGGCLAQRVADLVTEPREAARLIAAAARAVHHAHLHGVCHRDVKPSNILLRVRRPVPGVAGFLEGTTAQPPRHRLCDLDACVADFGLAKRTREDRGLTVVGAVVGTPGYMAPEQIRSEQPTPAADVYGLGAVLYECLTGRPPSRAATEFDTLLVTLHHEPERPRALNSRLPRDLETVCLKCLEKEPRRRYPSAEALADDLERWLRGEPVHARRVGLVGRAWRWCRRWPSAAALVAALVLALVGGMTGIVYQLQQARAANRQAEAALRETQASDAQSLHLLNELLPSSPSAPLQMRYSQRRPSIDPLLKAQAHFDDLLRKHPDDIRVRIALTNVRGTLGNLYGLRGQTGRMQDCFRDAGQLWESVVRQEPQNPQYRDWLATTYYWQAIAAGRQRPHPQALRFTQQAYALWQELADEQPDNVMALEKAAFSRALLLNVGDAGAWWEEMLPVLEEEKARLGKRLAEDAADTVCRKRLALTCLVLGELHRGRKADREAVACLRQAYEHYENLAGAQPEDPLVLMSLALCCFRLMTGDSADPYYTAAVARLGEAADRLTARTHKHPGNACLRHMRLGVYGYLAACHWKADRTAQAEAVFDNQVQPLLAQISQHPADWRGGALANLQDAARWVWQVKRPAAVQMAQAAAALAEKYADDLLHDPEFCEYLASASLSISILLNQLGRPAESVRVAEQARRLYTGLNRAAPDVLYYGLCLSSAWERIGKARSALGQGDEALAAFRQSAAVQRRVVEQAPSIPAYRRVLSRCYDRLVHWGMLHGDRATAAAALGEREKLWPNNAEELMEVGRDFEKLAQEVAKGRQQLSPPEQAERQHYLQESARLKQAAQAVLRDGTSSVRQ